MFVFRLITCMFFGGFLLSHIQTLTLKPLQKSPAPLQRFTALAKALSLGLYSPQEFLSSKSPCPLGNGAVGICPNTMK